MAQYDPTKRYTWKPEDTFVISGEEFGMMLNAFRNILSTPEAARILMVHQANMAVENVLARSVEEGFVKEVTEVPQLKVERNGNN